MSVYCVSLVLEKIRLMWKTDWPQIHNSPAAGSQVPEL